MITLHEIEQGSQEWHEAREGKYTGSNAHKLLGGVGVLDYAKATQDSFKGNFATRRGHALEPEAIELYEIITKTIVDRPGFVTNSKFETCLYSPDGITDTKVIEVKCFSESNHMQIYNGDIPLKVLAQIHFGLLICDKKLADLVIYNPKLDPKKAFKIIPVKYNPSIAANFKRILSASRVLA